MSHTKNRPSPWLFLPPLLFMPPLPLLLLGLRAAAQVPVAAPPAEPEAKPLTPAQAIALVGGPTLITLHVSGASVPQVVDAVIQQAGLTPVDTTHLGPAPDQKVTLDLDHVPFWKAMPLLTAQTHLVFAEGGPTSDQAILQPSYGGSNPMAGRVFEAAPFFVVANSAQRSNEGSFAYTETGASPSQGQQNLSVSLTLLVDPKISVVPGTMRLTVLEATDEAGTTLLRARPAETGINSNGRYAVRFGISLSSQSSSRRLQRLRGVLHVTAVAKRETWEIADLAAAVGTTKTLDSAGGPAHLSVVSVQPQNRGYRVSLTYQGPMFGLEFRPASALLFGGARLTDSLGNSVTGFAGTIRVSPAEADMARTNTAELTFTSRGATALTPPFKLTWTLPTAVSPVDIPFEFTNLPLP